MGDETKCSCLARRLIKRNHRRLNTRLAEVITHEQQSGVGRVASREVETGPVEVGKGRKKGGRGRRSDDGLSGDGG